MSNPVVSQVKCDECGFFYNLHERIFIVDKEPDIELTTIVCPSCNTETIALQTNSEIRTLQIEVNKERERANKKIRKGVPLNKAERKLRQVKRILRMVHAEQDIYRTNDGARISYCIGRILGYNDDSIFPWLGISINEQNQSVYSKLYADACEDSEISSAIKDFKEAREKLTLTFEELKKTLTINNS